jgi:predicted HD phosphohydrolase
LNNNSDRQTKSTHTKTKRTKHLLSNNKMPAPSPLVIVTSVLTRYVKEEKSYHQELDQQSARIAKLEAGEDADNENADFILRQQVSLLQKTFHDSLRLFD